MSGGSRVEGSVQMLLGEAPTLSGGTTITQDLLVPGTPTVTATSNAIWQGVQAGAGATTPTGYTVKLDNVVLRYLRTRTNPVTIPSVAAPPVSTGTRNVHIDDPGESAGDFATVRDLTLSGSAGQVAVPPGTYRNFTASGGGTFKLGVAGATQPALYSLQTLTLSGGGGLTVVGPVVIHLANTFTVTGQAGVLAHPEWLQVKISTGGATLSGDASLRGSILAPSGELNISGHGTLYGTAMCDRFRFSDGLVTWANTSVGAGNQAPVATSQSVTTDEDAAKPIVLTGTDADGNPLIFSVVTQPQHGTLAGSGANLTYTPAQDYFGPDSLTFIAKGM
jgi:hypothetical protein